MTSTESSGGPARDYITGPTHAASIVLMSFAETTSKYAVPFDIDELSSSTVANGNATLMIAHHVRVRWEVLLLLALVVAGVTGNLLVCIAVAVERKLQNVTNYFLVSLAVADLCVSLIVMPCCIVQEFIGYWPFGLVLCNAWQVTDVAMCTSSIMHMCTVSLDRYAGIRAPLKIRNRSKLVVAVKICAVWLVSLLIACPLIALGVYRPTDILTPDGQCAIFNSYFLIYGSLAAFFGPLGVMLVTYSLTIRLLSQRARQVEMIARQGMRRSITRRRQSSASQNSATTSSGMRSYLRKTVSGPDWNDYTSSTDNEVPEVTANGSRSAMPSGVTVDSPDSGYVARRISGGISKQPDSGATRASRSGSTWVPVPIVITTAGYVTPPSSTVIQADGLSSSAATSTVSSSGYELDAADAAGSSTRPSSTISTVTTRRFKQRRRQATVETSMPAATGVTHGGGGLRMKQRKRPSGNDESARYLFLKSVMMSSKAGRGISSSKSLPILLESLRSPKLKSSDERQLDVATVGQFPQQNLLQVFSNSESIENGLLSDQQRHRIPRETNPCKPLVPSSISASTTEQEIIDLHRHRSLQAPLSGKQSISIFIDLC